jgi:general secretion pathway protein G
MVFLDTTRESFCPRVARGFTLLELLVVLAILGLLAAFVAPRYFEQLGRSNTKVALAQLHALGNALDHYRVDVGRYPSTEQGLSALISAPAGEPRWKGPYLRRSLPVDPWGRAFLYTGPASGRDHELRSLGRDGAPGGDGEDSDVVLQ